MVDTKNLQAVSDYLQKNKNDIMKTYNAIGISVGKMHLNDQDFVIVVYLKDAQEAPKKAVVLDNVRLKFEVTGEFTLHHK